MISVKVQGSRSRLDGPWIAIKVAVTESAKSLGMLVTPGPVDHGRTVTETRTLEPLLIIVIIVHWRIEGGASRWIGQSMDIGPPEGLSAELILLDQEEAK